MPATAIPERQNVPEQDKWNLDSLYSRPEDWEKDLKKLEGLIPGIDRFRGTLGDSAAALKACLDYTVMEAGLMEERLAYYAMLRREENVGDADGQGRYSRFVSVATRLAAAASWIEPELLSLDDDTWKSLTADESLADSSAALRTWGRKRRILSR